MIGKVVTELLPGDLIREHDPADHELRMMLVIGVRRKVWRPDDFYMVLSLFSPHGTVVINDLHVGKRYWVQVVSGGA